MALRHLIQRFEIESHTVINSDRIAAADDHLSRMIGTRPLFGLAELVWNAVDANANKVDIRIETTVTGAVDRVIVTDDGHGFTVDEVRSLFGHVGGSWKHTAPHRKTRGGRRLLHGDKGEGRWKAFSVGDRISWSSVTRSDDGRNVATTLTMSANRLAEYEWSGSEPTDTKTGTTVVVDVGTKEPNSLLSPQARQTLTSIMALYLTQYSTVEIFYDGHRLTVDGLIAHKAELDVDYENEYGPVEVTVLEWNEKVERALFLCDENGATLHEDAPRIHAPGFVFTAYVRWAGFRVNESLLPLADFGNDEVGPALEAAREALRSYFRDKSVNDTKTVVQEWVDEEVYPFRDEATDAVHMAEQALFNFVAVSAADAVNRIEDRTAKALSLETMRIAIERDPSSVEYIMQEVLRLPESKVHEFRALLEQTSLTAIVDAMHLVTGRLRFIAALETLLFDPEHAPAVLRACPSSQNARRGTLDLW